MSHFISNQTRFNGPEGKENQRPTRIRTTGTSAFRRRMLRLDGDEPSTPVNGKGDRLRSEEFVDGNSPIPGSSPLVSRNLTTQRSSPRLDENSPMPRSSPYKLPTYTSFEELSASRSQPIIWKARNTERDALVTRLISPPSSDGSEVDGPLRETSFPPSSPPQLTSEDISELRHSEISPPASPLLPRLRSKSLDSNSSSSSFDHIPKDPSNNKASIPRDVRRIAPKHPLEAPDMFQGAQNPSLDKVSNHNARGHVNRARNNSLSSQGSGSSIRSDPIEALRDLSKILAKTPRTSKYKPQPDFTPEERKIMFSDPETFKAYLAKEGVYRDLTPEEKSAHFERQAQYERDYQDWLDRRTKAKAEQRDIPISSPPQPPSQIKSVEVMVAKQNFAPSRPTEAKHSVSHISQSIQVVPGNFISTKSVKQENYREQRDQTNSHETIDDTLDLNLGHIKAERMDQTNSLEAMDAKLNLGLSHIKDAKRGMDQLNRAIEVLPDDFTSTTTTTTFTSSPQDCTNITVSLPRLWSRDPQKSLGITFTWLGLLLTSFLAWYLAESIACELYCHPINSTSYYWSPDDPFFPWAIPTKLDHWSGRVVSRLLWYLGDFVRVGWRMVSSDDGSLTKLGERVIYY